MCLEKSKSTKFVSEKKKTLLSQNMSLTLLNVLVTPAKSLLKKMYSKMNNKKRKEHRCCNDHQRTRAISIESARENMRKNKRQG